MLSIAIHFLFCAAAGLVVYALAWTFSLSLPWRLLFALVGVMGFLWLNAVMPGESE